MTIGCIVRNSVLLATLLVFLSGCQSKTFMFPFAQGGSAPTAKKLQAVDYFKTTRPAKICGKDGWEFLQREFFGPQCGSCHGDGGLGPYAFNSANRDTRYSEALSIPVEDLLTTSKRSPFLPGTSDLSSDGDVYKGIVEWTTQANTCL